nr:hypothetical protein [uncultured bacterium]BAH89947.1 hypothetical protein [uncultured bacterium]BAH90345.1 hypothetical protein [uncultured bacterium]
MVAPGTKAPALGFDTVAHGVYEIGAEAPPGGTYLFFARGRHCKWTRMAIKDLDDRIGDFALRAIRVAAVTSLDREAAAQLKDELQIIRLPIGYGLDVLRTAADWGLYVTHQSTEPDAPHLHWEPGQFWVTSDGMVGLAASQSGPNLWADNTNAIRAIENTGKFPERGRGGPQGKR